MASKEIEPLREGRISIKDQAARARIPVPVGATVKELEEHGFDVDPLWPRHARLAEESASPTGLVVKWPREQTDIYALAT